MALYRWPYISIRLSNLRSEPKAAKGIWFSVKRFSRLSGQGGVVCKTGYSISKKKTLLVYIAIL
jgi:hypothetical protein